MHTPIRSLVSQSDSHSRAVTVMPVGNVAASEPTGRRALLRAPSQRMSRVRGLSARHALKLCDRIQCSSDLLRGLMSSDDAARLHSRQGDNTNHDNNRTDV